MWVCPNKPFSFLDEDFLCKIIVVYFNWLLPVLGFLNDVAGGGHPAPFWTIEELVKKLSETI